MKFGGIGIPELLIILAVALLIFGPKNLPKLGSALGKTVKNLRDGIGGPKEADEEADEDVEEEEEIEEEEEPVKKAAKKSSKKSSSTEKKTSTKKKPKAKDEQ